MRKVLSFVLVLALVLGSFSMVFGAGYSDMAGEDSSEAVDVLSSLGVISGYPDGTFKPDRIVTRAEMAKLIVAALGLEKFATATTSKYPDMTAAPWAQGFVAYGTSLGFISGYPDGTFKPNNTVTYEEACSMIVRALGYTSEFLPGEWPAEWVIKAKSLGILDGVTFGSSAGANRGDIAEMLYNSLALAIGYVDKDGNWQEYANDTMLVRLGAKFVAADDLTSNAAIIFGDEDTMISLRAYVGAYADRYLNKDDEIIKVLPQSTFITGEYVGGGVFEADNDVDYNVPESLQHYWVPYFYNGEYDGTCDLGCYEDYTFKVAVDLSGKTIKAIYSISEWEVTEAFLFDDDYADQIADDQELGENAFILDDNDDIDFMAFDWFGAKDLEDIDEDNVVYVYAYSGDIRRIEVGKEVVTGEITKINSTGSKVTVGGKAYELADMSEDDAVWDALNLEDEVEFYLDFAGKVFAIELVEAAEGENYAVILETDDGTTGLSGSDGLVKLFLADGTAKIFKVDDDLVVDDVIEADGDWVTSFAGITAAGTLVEYGVDEDGVIDYLDVLSLDNSYGEVTSKGYFAGKLIAADAVIFTYDGEDTLADLSDKDNYGVTTLANVKGNEYDDVDFLVDGKIVLMMIWGAGVTGDDVYGVVNSFYQTTASNTDYAATLLVNGVEKVYDISKTVFDARTGYDKANDFYMLTLNTKGEITALDDQDGVAYVNIVSGIVTKAYGSGLISVDGVEYTIDLDTIVYKYNTDDSVFKVAALTRTNLGLDAVVELYDTDEDGVTDTILVL